MAVSEYSRVLAWLYGLEAAKGMDFKLDRVALALAHLGDPHKRLAAVHVAGTNGKGSVAAMLHAVFTAAGYRVGLYTSPHLVSFTERIRIGAESINETEVVDLAAEIRSAATVRGIELTFFEFVTVMAFLHFARQSVDLAVVEVGLGGRLDATNVVDPEVAVITSIAMDHEEFLGNTLESVAHEKAGIIKSGRVAIVGFVQPAVQEIFESVAVQRRASLQIAGRDYGVSASSPFRFSGMGVEIDGLNVGLRGKYQRDNAATAVAVAVELRRKFTVPDAAIRRGIAEVRWPGRLDVVQMAPLVVLDGAHNAAGVAALVRELPALVGQRDIHLLFGVMRDKRWQPMVDALGAVVASATLTAALPPRGEDPQVLARSFARYCPVSVAQSPADGLVRLMRFVGQNGAVVVAGSLFLIGAVYPHFLGRGRQALFDSGPAPLHI